MTVKQLPITSETTNEPILLVPSGKIRCYVHPDVLRNDTPEEHVRQRVARSLVEEYGYEREDLYGWAASQHILRIIPQENVTHPGFLAAFLSTPYGQHQLKAKIYGGVVDELTAEDTEIILIPDVPYSEQLAIGETVVRVYELRDEANVLEDEAIAQLEAIISG